MAKPPFDFPSDDERNRKLRNERHKNSSPAAKFAKVITTAAVIFIVICAVKA